MVESQMQAEVVVEITKLPLKVDKTVMLAITRQIQKLKMLVLNFHKPNYLFYTSNCIFHLKLFI